VKDRSSLDKGEVVDQRSVTGDGLGANAGWNGFEIADFDFGNQPLEGRRKPLTTYRPKHFIEPISPMTCSQLPKPCVLSKSSQVPRINSPPVVSLPRQGQDSIGAGVDSPVDASC
jgi:hypothetical protein